MTVWSVDYALFPPRNEVLLFICFKCHLGLCGVVNAIGHQFYYFLKLYKKKYKIFKMRRIEVKTCLLALFNDLFMLDLYSH